MDKEHLDVELHSAGLIQRVLEYGTLQDWRLTRDYYGMDRIVADCKRLRTLCPLCLSRLPGRKLKKPLLKPLRHIKSNPVAYYTFKAHNNINKTITNRNKLTPRVGDYAVAPPQDIHK